MEGLRRHGCGVMIFGFQVLNMISALTERALTFLFPIMSNKEHRRSIRRYSHKYIQIKLSSSKLNALITSFQAPPSWHSRYIDRSCYIMSKQNMFLTLSIYPVLAESQQFPYTQYLHYLSAKNLLDFSFSITFSYDHNVTP